MQKKYYSIPICKKTPHFLFLCLKSLALRIEKGGKKLVSYRMRVKHTCLNQLSADTLSILSFQLQELVQYGQYFQSG